MSIVTRFLCCWFALVCLGCGSRPANSPDGLGAASLGAGSNLPDGSAERPLFTLYFLFDRMLGFRLVTRAVDGAVGRVVEFVRWSVEDDPTTGQAKGIELETPAPAVTDKSRIGRP